MTITHNRYLKLVGLILISLGFLAACSRPAPEEQLIEVGEDVSEMQGELAALNAHIDRHMDAIDELRQERQQARSKLMTLEERLEKRATDLAIFRAAQRALLDEPTLRDAAVLASVEDGRVTLDGTVASRAQQEKAAELVRSVPGVSSTVVRLRIIDEAADDSNE